MNSSRPRRVMWLLNHGAARKFEVPMLKEMGFDEIYLPKSYPNDPSFRSASLDFSEDQHLTIPENELEILNSTDWYGDPSPEAWEIANRHFDALFFILHYPEFISSMCRNFKGIVIWRVYGREIETNYDAALSSVTRDHGPRELKSLGARLYFGIAYEHLHLAEPEYLRSRALFLPLGLQNVDVSTEWEGHDKRVLFVCPDIEANDYYTKVYENFINDFSDLPYVVGGVQSVASSRPNVLGYLSAEEYERNMKQLRVMYYHSVEPNHVHYHPFEAIKAGMPLVFRAGGLLDRLGGKNLPGRATSVSQAHSLLRRILAGERKLIEAIRSSQRILLEQMSAAYCEPFWRSAMGRLETTWAALDAVPRSRSRKSITVFLPLPYRGGSFNAAKLIIEAVKVGAEEHGEDVEVILAHTEDGRYTNEDFADLPVHVPRRAFSWRAVGGAEARRAMTLAGQETWRATADRYLIPEDGVDNFYKSDLWIVISDRLTAPLLPLRPTVSIVYDYIQRYVPLWDRRHTLTFLTNTWFNERVFTTTEFTRRDAIQFGGLPPQRVTRLPIAIPHKPSVPELTDLPTPTTFVWPTNASPHKNHLAAVQALETYYEELGGELVCVVTGVDSRRLLAGGKGPAGNTSAALNRLIASKRLRVSGYLNGSKYFTEVQRAAFLWHPTKIDNGTFSVAEAAYLGVPSLVGDYPAMREMDQELGLRLTFSSTHDPRQMAEALKAMEASFTAARSGLPSPEQLEEHSPKGVGRTYWMELSKCL